MADGKMREGAERTGRREISARRAESRWNGLRVILLLAFYCAINVGIGIFFSYRDASRGPEGGLVYEVNVVSGNIPEKSREERQREMDSMAGGGMLAMPVNITSSGEVSDGRMTNWLIEGPSNQGKLIRVEITWDDTGEKIYGTGAIRLDSYVESVPFNVELPAGTYECTAIFLAYKEETEALTGQTAMKATLALQE